MCGIAGLWHAVHGIPADRGSLDALAAGMADALRHRGPDDGGVWSDAGAGVALAHRRLAVIDVTAAGHQPMHSPAGRYTIVFNGEIYNHMALREALAGEGVRIAWRGHSDTESLLAGIEVWGLEDTLRRCVGMFAVALWDRQARRLSLARDRLGEKPLYYGWQRGALLFGSELVALRRHPAFRAAVDRDALARYLNRGYVAGAASIYEGILRLPPGCVLHVEAADAAAARCPAPQPYWTLPTHAQAATQDVAGLNDRDAADRLLDLLRGSVRGQMISDVSLGAFLSGGIDSTLVVSLMQELSDRPVKTFTIGFSEPRFDEAPFARRIAQHLGTEHHELYVTPQDALDVVAKLPELYSEPLGDSSQIPTFIVAGLARRHVTVALSGDAGDELFCGYERYFLADALWERLARVPVPLRQAALPLLRALPVAVGNGVGRALCTVLPVRLRRPRLGDDLQRGADVLRASSAMAVYRSVLSQDPTGGALVRGGQQDAWPEVGASQLSGEAFFEGAMQLDRVTYLPDDILVKVDRAAMAVSLETRVPFLDHRVVEFAVGLALRHKLAPAGTGSRGKHILRTLLSRYVPTPLFERPKAGFSVPVAAWLQGPLRDWGESLVQSGDAADLLDMHRVRVLWRQHVTGQRDWQYVLWSLLMFLAWHRAQAARG
jgi:asparagine synthase (glutamine-hydrolysing)